MGQTRRHRTDGGVKKHAVDRVIKQYSSCLSVRNIRRVLREAMGLSGIKNGQLVLNDAQVVKLRMKNIPTGNKIIILIQDEIVRTVKDNPLRLRI